MLQEMFREVLPFVSLTYENGSATWYKKKNIMAIGDNYNDHELLQEAGIAISADKSRVKGNFYVPLKGKFLPSDKLMQEILSLKRTTL